ncbi:MAG: family 43 glycosylhydrolase [Eubacteriales bacterium]|nr:family 43 glycosylhydrolase [Eubacteriales bacterium]
MAQVFNPYLPLHEYIPDGEPHVFDGRIYLFGSHDAENGDTFCMNPYEFYSASIDDLRSWTSRGISYKAEQDPMCSEKRKYLYAPDVVRGNDGRYYLYYALSGYRGKGGYFGPIAAAVCDTPDGEYTYLGIVRNADGSMFREGILFDPAVINDEGTIRLYYGSQYPFPEKESFVTRMVQSKLYGKTMEEIKSAPDGIMGPMCVTLADDMLTVTSRAVHIITPHVKGTEWEEHPFFEGASIRRINGLYYFIYSSLKNHELCYAVSHYPDRDFTYGGTIISNGDVGYNGRKEEDRLNATGTTHGSIECINGQWYVFYHRLTHGSDYSRQSCAEPITIAEDGSIAQVEMTSCGLNGAPLVDTGVYPAVICCNLTNGHMPHSSNKKSKKKYPCVSSGSGQQFIANIENGTWIGYKYFSFTGTRKIRIRYRGTGDGFLTVTAGYQEKALARVRIGIRNNWTDTTVEVPFQAGKSGLFFHFEGTGSMELLEFELQNR